MRTGSNPSPPSTPVSQNAQDLGQAFANLDTEVIRFASGGGPWGILGTVTTGIIRQFRELQEASVQMANAFSDLKVLTNNSQSAANLDALSGTGGFSPEVAAKYREIETSARDPEVMRILRENGADIAPDTPGHRVDPGQELENLVRSLRAKPQDERYYDLYKLHLPELRNITDVSPETYRDVERLTHVSEHLNDPERRQKAADEEFRRNEEKKIHDLNSEWWSTPGSGWWNKLRGRDKDMEETLKYLEDDAKQHPILRDIQPPSASSENLPWIQNGLTPGLGKLPDFDKFFSDAKSASDNWKQSDELTSQLKRLADTIGYAIEVLSGNVAGRYAGWFGVGEHGQNAYSGYQPGDYRRIKMAHLSGGLRIGVLGPT